MKSGVFGRMMRALSRGKEIKNRAKNITFLVKAKLL